MPFIKPHQLLHLLRRRLSLPKMPTPTPNPNSNRSGSILSRVFPFKFHYMGLNPKPYTTRPFRTRPDNEKRVPKSLIEDEEELSNWVSELRTRSYKAGLVTDEEEEEERRGTKGRKRERERGKERGKGEGDLGSLRDVKRVRFGEGRGEWSRNDDDWRRDRGRFGDSRGERSGDRGRIRGAFDDGEDEGIGDGRRELRRDGRGGMRKGREDDFGRKGASCMGNSRHSGRKESSFRRSIESEDDLSDEEEEEAEKEEVERGWGSRRKKGGGKEGGRKLELRRGSDRGRGRGGGRGEKGNGRVARVVSEDESDGNEGKSVSSFVDLIGEEESDSDDEDVEEEAVGKLENKSTSSLFAKDVAEDSAVPSSQGESDSYLSETRFDQCAVSPLTLKGIKDAGYEKMTWVQEATLPGRRTRVSDEFRKSKGLILVTSDVSARGVAYPDVTLVIQLGVPSDREQYIHRLGRTGRKGKEGQGILLLAPWEESFLSSIKDLSITKAPVPSIDPDVTKQVERALAKVDMKEKERAYQAWLGYCNSSKVVGRDKFRLVELANEFSRCMGTRHFSRCS
ncbi:DEAD-box ATP-dependent RNA helicase 31-like protein [Drosera capensis]